MPSQTLKTGICLFLLLVITVTITFFLTKDHYEHDHEINQINLTQNPIINTTHSTTNQTENPPILVIDNIPVIPNPQNSVSSSPSVPVSSSPSVSFNNYVNDLPRCITANNNKMLIVYDSDINDDFGYLSELYAIVASNLVSHFRKSDVVHINDYKDVCGYGNVMYVGYNYNTNSNLQRFINDVFSNLENTPVMWLGTNIWKIVNSTTESNFGFRYLQQRNDVRQIFYKGEWIDRNIRNDGISEIEIFNHHRTELLSYTYTDNKNIPWAVYSNRNFMYISEIPFSFIDHDDRFVVFSDLLFEFFDVRINRNRALVRLEDIGPQYNVDKFLSSVNYLKSQNVPFSFGVFPVYVSRTRTLRLRESPLMVQAIKHATNSGGTLIFHGLTHQYKNLSNPYEGESGTDFEFYLTHVDPQTQSVIYDGPVPEDSRQWVENRLQEGLDEFEFVGIKLPTIFEFPHYVGSDLDYRIVAEKYLYRYDRGQYYIGSLHNSTIDYSKHIGHFNPFVIRDIYGSIVIPENLGNFIQSSINNNKNRYSIDIVNSARLNKNIMRDSVASFFFHPFLGTEYLAEIVSGIKELGYTFVSPNEIVNNFNV